VDHEGEDAHLSGAAVVQLDGELLADRLVVPAGCLELSSLDVVFASSVSELNPHLSASSGNSSAADNNLKNKSATGGSNSSLNSGNPYEKASRTGN
jgi:hypothetical protein